MKDLISNIGVSQILEPQVATTSKTSSAIDMRGANSLAVAFFIGQSDDTLSGSVKWELSLEHSDDNSGYTAVDESQLTYSAQDHPKIIDDAADDERVVVYGYNGGKRYVKGLITATGTHENGTPVAIAAIKGALGFAPAFETE